MKTVWVTAGQVFDGAELRDDLAIAVCDGVVVDAQPIADVGPVARQSFPGLITPGFVDLQVNGGGGVLVNTAPDPAGIRAVAEAHRALGTVAILPTVITDAPAVMEQAASAVIALKDDLDIIGLHLEGPHIDPAKRGTHDPAHIRPLDDATLQIVRGLRGTDVPVMITLAPEAATMDQIAELAQMGALVSLGHSNCTAEVAARAFAAGATCVTHLYNAMSGMSGRAPGLAGAAINGEAFCGMIADGVHVSDQMIGVAVRARPRPDRCFLVSDAMPTVGGPDHFTLYGQQITVTDGRLTNAEGNLAGAHTTIAEGLARMVKVVGVPLETALRMAVTTPATVIGAPELRGLVGRWASDILVLDTGLNVTGTLHDAIGKRLA